jgi:capsular polysaccharide biosynthesis protein
MEYVELLSIIKAKYLKISQFILGFVTFFILLFFITPDTYVTEGTLYIYPINNFKQKQEVSLDMNFSRNVIGLSESPEFRRKVSNSDLNFIPFIGISTGFKLKEVTPNLVSVSVKDYSKEGSFTKYQKYIMDLTSFSESLKKGTSSFEISPLEADPVTYKTSKNIYLNLILGAVLGFFVGIFYYYFKKGKLK